MKSNVTLLRYPQKNLNLNLKVKLKREAVQRQQRQRLSNSGWGEVGVGTVDGWVCRRFVVVVGSGDDRSPNSGVMKQFKLKITLHFCLL